jgi:hypothetical protein
MRSGILILVSGSMISKTSPPEEKFPAGARQHDRAHIRGIGQIAEEIAQLRITVEGEWILAFGAIEPHRRDAPVVARLEAEMARWIVL